MGASSSRHENEGCQRTDHIPISKQDARVQLPHNVECIIGDADVQVDRSSAHGMYQQLRAGVFLNNKRKKYWVDQAGNNCFIVYARDLSITWSEDGRYWQWLSQKDMSSEELVDVVKLENVCWLEVHGKFEMSKLSPNVVYEVAFIVKIVAESAYGWEVPVNFRLRLPNGSKQESKINLMEKPRGQWIKVPAGEFETSSELKGEIEYSLYEYEDGKWKRGLMIMGVSIQPKQL
uniref:Uncharacterized protein n=1 Tax=Kalanchoe fedtschenkoi TaxID=63787 RepID=A0A7N0ZZS2_KALFE